MNTSFKNGDIVKLAPWISTVDLVNIHIDENDADEVHAILSVGGAFGRADKTLIGLLCGYVAPGNMVKYTIPLAWLELVERPSSKEDIVDVGYGYMRLGVGDFTTLADQWYRRDQMILEGWQHCKTSYKIDADMERVFIHRRPVYVGAGYRLVNVGEKYGAQFGDEILGDNGVWRRLDLEYSSPLYHAPCPIRRKIAEPVFLSHLEEQLRRQRETTCKLEKEIAAKPKLRVGMGLKCKNGELYMLCVLTINMKIMYMLTTNNGYCWYDPVDNINDVFGPSDNFGPWEEVQIEMTVKSINKV